MSIKMNINGKLEQISGQLYHADIFPGMVMMGANVAAPYGWLKCDGAAYLKTDYPELYAAIGDTYNKPGVEVGKFNVPDMTGRYVMGPDTGNAVGKNIDEQLPNIKGTYSARQLTEASQSWGTVEATGCLYDAGNSTDSRCLSTSGLIQSPSKTIGFDASEGGTKPVWKDNAKVRPDSVVLSYFIKF